MEILPTIIIWMLFFILGMIIVFLSLMTSKFAKLFKKYDEYLDNNEVEETIQVIDDYDKKVIISKESIVSIEFVTCAGDYGVLVNLTTNQYIGLLYKTKEKANQVYEEITSSCFNTKYLNSIYID